MRPALTVSVLLCAFTGCTTVSSELRATQALYSDARYEEGARFLDALAPELASMTDIERAHFYYLRGMTAYRLGQRDDALHYLMLAATLVAADNERIEPRHRAVMERALEQLTPTTASWHARVPGAH